MKFFLFAGLAVLAFTSCKKYVICDNAEVCIKNVGKDTIWYGWNSGNNSNKLRPGETTCDQVGEIDTDPNNGTGKRTSFSSNHGNYFFDVKECHMEKEID